MRIAVTAALFAILTSAAAFGQVETIDGRSIEGNISRIADGKVVVAGKSETTLAIDELLSWSPGKVDSDSGSQTAVAAGAPADRSVIVTLSGDRIYANSLTLADGKFKFTSPSLGTMQMEMSAVKAIYHRIESMSTSEIVQNCQNRKYVNGSMDLLIVAKQKQSEKADSEKKEVKEGEEKPAESPKEEESSIANLEWYCFEGVAKAIAVDSSDNIARVVFNYQAADTTVEWSSVPAIFFPIPAECPKLSGVLTAMCGSRFPFTSIMAADGKVEIEIPGMGKTAIAKDKIAVVEMKSSRLTMLQDLKPSSVEERGFFGTTFPYHVNFAVSGEPLTLDGQAYAGGIGMHSYSCLSYDVAGKYKLFTARVGIDDAVRPRGDAAISIFGDGKELLKPTRLTGGEKSQTIRVDLSGVKTLTIKVDFGQDNIDISDHVDIVDPRLVQ